MKKPLTKEEFLERKNSEIHKELLAVFESKSNSDAIAGWFRQFLKSNPKISFCLFSGRPEPPLKVTYIYQAIFLNMCEMLKSGELVFKPELCKDCEFEDVNGILFIARVCKKHNKKLEQ